MKARGLWHARSQKARWLTGLWWLAACGSDAAPAISPAPTVSAAAGASGAVQAPAAVTTPAPVIAAPAAPPPAAPAADVLPPSAAAGALPCAVSQVLAASCQNCHGATPIGGAPMPLMTYEDLLKTSTTQPTKKVYELVQARIHDTKRPMPPIGTLAPADVAAIDAWVQGGAKSAPASETACAKAPDKPVAGNVDGSRGRLTPGPGETCYEFKVHGSTTSVDDTEFNIGDGEFYEQFYYRVPWTADTVATAYATIADNAQVLHHWLLFSTNEAQPHGSHITAPLPTLIGTDPVLLAGWAVGGPNLVAPKDVGFELPDPGTRTINVQWHFYNSTGKPQTDGSSVQICTVPRAMRKHVGGVTWLGTEDLNGNKWFGGAGMPPMQESTFTTTCVPGRRGMSANESIHIIGFEPHMHRIGKRMTTSVKRMDGSVQKVFDEPFSFGNETHYYVDHELKPGEQLITSCTFFNDNNFGVPFGESTDTEMCYQFTFAYPAHAISNGAPSLLGVTDTCW